MEPSRHGVDWVSRRSRSRSPKRNDHRSRSRSPTRHVKPSLESSLPNSASRSSSRKGQGGYGSKESSSAKKGRSRSPSSRKDSSSNEESGDDSKGTKGVGDKSKDFLFVRADSIPGDVLEMGRVVAEMDQACTGVAVRAAMLLDAVVNLLPSGSQGREKASLFASYVKDCTGSGTALIQAASFGLEAIGKAVLSNLCLRIVRRILSCATADIPIMAFSAANAVILGSHDPSLPKLSSKEGKMVDCSSQTTFNEIMKFLVQWARIVYLVDPVYGAAISGLTCVVIGLRTNNESVIVIHEYIQLMKKLVVSGDGETNFYPLFFVLQTQTLEQAKKSVIEKARVKPTETKAAEVEEVVPRPPKKQWGRGQGLGSKGTAWGAAPDGRDKGAIMAAGATMSDHEMKASSCHGWNNGTACTKLSPEGKCFFIHVCNVCLSSNHGRSACPKRAKKE